MAELVGFVFLRLGEESIQLLVVEILQIAIVVGESLVDQEDAHEASDLRNQQDEPIDGPVQQHKRETPSREKQGETTRNPQSGLLVAAERREGLSVEPECLLLHPTLVLALFGEVPEDDLRRAWVDLLKPSEPILVRQRAAVGLVPRCEESPSFVLGRGALPSNRVYVASSSLKGLVGASTVPPSSSTG